MNEDELTGVIERALKGNRQEPPYLHGCYWSIHALARMRVRDIELDWVIDSMQTAGRPTDNPDVFKHVGTMAMCLVNHRTREVITIGYGHLNNPEEVKK